MNWIRNALRLCQHKWATHQVYDATDTISGKPRGQIWLLRCEHCGDLKTKRVK